MKAFVDMQLLPLITEHKSRIEMTDRLMDWDKIFDKHHGSQMMCPNDF